MCEKGLFMARGGRYAWQETLYMITSSSPPFHVKWPPYIFKLFFNLLLAFQTTPAMVPQIRTIIIIKIHPIPAKFPRNLPLQQEVNFPAFFYHYTQQHSALDPNKQPLGNTTASLFPTSWWIGPICFFARFFVQRKISIHVVYYGKLSPQSRLRYIRDQRFFMKTCSAD